MFNTTLKQFQKELGSKNATPGGGVVAALAGSFAASLVEMVCNLTIDKLGYEKVQKNVIKIHKESLEFKKKFERLAEEDKKAFDKVLSSYKTKDKELIKKSLRYAIEVPMEVRRLAIETEKLAFHIGKIGNKNAYSDAKTAIHLAHAASKSALENIKINKVALKRL
ncbi:MAG: cyclodeaminase/cyclohydrolase family protein [Patescibacteria group bacterium]